MLGVDDRYYSSAGHFSSKLIHCIITAQSKQKHLEVRKEYDAKISYTKEERFNTSGLPSDGNAERT